MGNMATENAAGARISSLLDAGSFVEIGGAVTARNTDFNMQQKETPADGVITGYGVIDGNLVYVYSQDASVLGGAMGEMHAKKIANIYDMAMKMGAPVIGLVDCAGFRLQEATDALEAFGSLYLKQTMASGVIPQITAIFGNCGGGLSVVPALSDFTFMEKGAGKLFVNSPNAIPGNTAAKLDTSSAEFQSEKSGLVDEIGSEEEILESIRSLVCMLPCNNEEDASYDECADDLNRVCEGIENAAEDTAIALTQISDSQIFFEAKKHYAKDMVTGFFLMFENQFSVDSIHEGTITEMTDKGAVVALGENVEGFCPARQLTKEDGTTPKVGDKLDFKVLEFSKATKRITLSHLRTYEEAKRAEVAAEKAEKRAAADATKSTVKKINASVEKTTLGDIAGLAALKSAMEAAEAKNAKKAAKEEKAEE